jgi:hypothetical protein
MSNQQLPSFYDLGPLEKVAVNLFYGWGYNFYRTENQLRADDQLVRSKVGLLLGQARTSLDAAQSNYRRVHLPPPSREKPRHDADAIAGAQTIERLARAVGSLQGLITAQPVPENDRMTQRHRQEAATLERLIESDKKLVGQAELLRASVEGKDGKWLVENEAAIQDGINAIGETLRNRQLLLFPTL